jgi:hypothetical protein
MDYAAGWRPTLGYVCTVGLAYQLIVYPALAWTCAAFFPDIEPPDPLSTGNLIELVLGAFGLAGWRTFEKIKGVA